MRFDGHLRVAVSSFHGFFCGGTRDVLVVMGARPLNGMGVHA